VCHSAILYSYQKKKKRKKRKKNGALMLECSALSRHFGDFPNNLADQE
jgi:hypothetical protein